MRSLTTGWSFACARRNPSRSMTWRGRSMSRSPSPSCTRFPDARRFFTEIFTALKKGGNLLFSEPAGHVTEDGFAGSISLARAVGFDVGISRKVFRSHTALLTK